MKQQGNPSYESINFEQFSNVQTAEVLTRAEGKRIFRRFLKGEQQKSGKRSSQYRAYTAAACLCLIVFFLVSPMGDKAMAAVKQAAVGIGQFLGMETEDDYAMVLDETQTKEGVTLTLHEVVASDHEFRYSVTGTKADGTILDSSQIGSSLWINGEHVGWDIEGTGWGPFGASDPQMAKEEEKGLHFYSNTYMNYEMPLNPKIRLELHAGGKNVQVHEPFVFEFTLNNAAFKKATKTIPINKTVTVHGKEMVLGDLILSPIDQYITLKNWKEWEKDCERGMDLTLFGTDDSGTEVWFHSWGDREDMRGCCADDSKGTYELNPDVKSYTLYPKYYVYPESGDEEGKEFVGREKLVIKVE